MRITLHTVDNLTAVSKVEDSKLTYTCHLYILQYIQSRASNNLVLIQYGVLCCQSILLLSSSIGHSTEIRIVCRRLQKLNFSNPATGQQKLIDIDDERRVRCFFEKRMSQEVAIDSVGDEFKGYVVKITGGNDKQG